MDLSREGCTSFIAEKVKRRAGEKRQGGYSTETSCPPSLRDTLPQVAVPPLSLAESPARFVPMINKCWGHSPDLFRDQKILFSTFPHPKPLWCQEVC